VTDANGGATLVAIGNIHGQGEVLLDRLYDLPTTAARTTPHRVSAIDRVTIARRLAQHHFDWLLNEHTQIQREPISFPAASLNPIYPAHSALTGAQHRPPTPVPQLLMPHETL
jgi:hypothetical protein